MNLEVRSVIGNMAKWHKTPKLWYSDRLGETVYDWITAQGIDESDFGWETDFTCITYLFKYKKDLTWFLLSHAEIINRIQCSGLIGINDDGFEPYQLW